MRVTRPQHVMRRHEPHAGIDHAIPSLALVIPLTKPLLALAQQA